MLCFVLPLVKLWLGSLPCKIAAASIPCTQRFISYAQCGRNRNITHICESPDQDDIRACRGVVIGLLKTAQPDRH